MGLGKVVGHLELGGRNIYASNAGYYCIEKGRRRYLNKNEKWSMRNDNDTEDNGTSAGHPNMNFVNKKSQNKSSQSHDSNSAGKPKSDEFKTPSRGSSKKQTSTRITKTDAKDRFGLTPKLLQKFEAEVDHITSWNVRSHFPLQGPMKLFCMNEATKWVEKNRDMLDAVRKNRAKRKLKKVVKAQDEHMENDFMHEPPCKKLKPIDITKSEKCRVSGESLKIQQNQTHENSILGSFHDDSSRSTISIDKDIDSTFNRLNADVSPVIKPPTSMKTMTAKFTPEIRHRVEDEETCISCFKVLGKVTVLVVNLAIAGFFTAASIVVIMLRTTRSILAVIVTALFEIIRYKGRAKSMKS